MVYMKDIMSLLVVLGCINYRAGAGIMGPHGGPAMVKSIDSSADDYQIDCFLLNAVLDTSSVTVIHIRLMHFLL